MWAPLSIREHVILVGVAIFSVYQTFSGSDLGRDSQVQDTKDKDLDFRVHFTDEIRGLKRAFSLFFISVIGLVVSSPYVWRA